ncbi:MAG: TIGR00730 family Rossman fold protein [Promethearchaeota archaeon]
MLENDENKKTICVYCSSSLKIDDKFHKVAYQLGKLLMDAGFNLLWGGCRVGLMNEIALGAKNSSNDQKGKLIGVIPKLLLQKDLEFKKCDKLIVVKNLNERKRVMKDRSDCFIVLPGGFGTLDEFFDTLAEKILGFHNKPIIIFNFDNYYEGIFKFFEKIYHEGFASTQVKNKYKIANSIDEIIRIIEEELDLSLN